jgi:hypothetical protein
MSPTGDGVQDGQQRLQSNVKERGMFGSVLVREKNRRLLCIFWGSLDLWGNLGYDTAILWSIRAAFTSGTGTWRSLEISILILSYRQLS